MKFFLSELVNTTMDYISFNFYLLLIISLFLYYLFPRKHRWVILLLSSLTFYYFACGKRLDVIVVFAAGIFVSYGFSLLTGKIRSPFVLAISIAVSSIPFLYVRAGLLLTSLIEDRGLSLIIPLGISYYTLQIIAYLVDIYRGKVKVQKNPLKYALFISFFPQIIQGPIPRYKELYSQINRAEPFNEKLFIKGVQMMLWGLFLKIMIADKAAPFVNKVFDNGESFFGAYILMAGILLCVQLYADFLSCTCLSIGAAYLFGIRLKSNFDRPYFSATMSEFWTRWHISLGTWLRDYVYIPLGGSKKGTVRKYINLFIAFMTSALWHGILLNYIFWGIIQIIYQLMEEAVSQIKLKRKHTGKENHFRDSVYNVLRALRTSALFMLSLIFIRAKDFRTSIIMLKNMFSYFNPWVIFDGSLCSTDIVDFGLDFKEWIILLAATAVLFAVEICQSRVEINELILEQNFILRWIIYYAVIILIIIFGTYGFNYDAGAFIYGGF